MAVGSTMPLLFNSNPVRECRHPKILIEVTIAKKPSLKTTETKGGCSKGFSVGLPSLIKSTEIGVKFERFDEVDREGKSN
jgi:hypothetical protein